ncbi:unnamed protein product [Allacma fusca]|uniref:AMP-dependent synthetase/ligase domain-containing protein n=1 Tax=Allacma fusca TaxID=39272 RepID=A0A8J2NTN2_9HEXA|nr:unnamed protein product [Allacma fusca]
MKNTKTGSCGTPVSSTIIKVVDTETGRVLGPNEPGELLVKGPQVMKGYLNNEEATNETIDSDGWLHSGDIGYYDDSYVVNHNTTNRPYCWADTVEQTLLKRLV